MSAFHPNPCTEHNASYHCRAFSLVELLVVLGITGIMMTVLVPALGLNRAADVARTVWDLSSFLEEARSYAMAKNTFVYVGIGEFDALANKGSYQAGSGRIALLAVASRTGSSIPPGTAATPSLAVGISKIRVLEGVSLTGDQSRASALVRPTAGLFLNETQTPLLSLPVGSSVPTISVNRVLEIDPRGKTRPWDVASMRSIQSPLELLLVPSRGNRVLDPASGEAANLAAIQIDGLTGAVTVFRP
jgi:prepilin-type N-terminal cleavage/methylation domain-containing protein